MKASVFIPALAAFALLGACTSETEHGEQAAAKTDPAMLQTPQSIAIEHRELHKMLASAANEPGELGEAARNLEAVLAPHFRREEEIASPPLSLLPRLAEGQPTADMRSVLSMTDALEEEMPQMLREHGAIKQAAGALGAAAGKAGRPEYVRFAETLAGHARQEEEILYPAAILVGRYVKQVAPD